MTFPFSPTPRAEAPVRPSWRWLLTVAAIMLCIGIASGIVVDRVVSRPAWRHGWPERPPYGTHPGGPHRLGDRIARELDLTAAQRTQIDSIMARRTREIERTRQQIHPQLQQIFAETRAEIDSALTPQQRDRLHQLFPHHRHGPPE